MAFLPHARNLIWTAHSRDKMRQYRLGEGRIRRILNSPHRVEEGIAEGTVAMMQRSDGKNPYELWVMIVDEQKGRKVISAWRYPGVTEPRNELPAAVKHGLQRAIEEALGENGV